MSIEDVKARWTKAPSGGYQRAVCKCEIECTPDNINEVCGADIAIALDMSQCDETIWEQMTEFVNHLLSDMDLEPGLGGARNTARIALMVFSSYTDEKIQMELWNGDISDINQAQSNLKRTLDDMRTNSMWTVYRHGIIFICLTLRSQVGARVLNRFLFLVQVQTSPRFQSF